MKKIPKISSIVFTIDKNNRAQEWTSILFRDDNPDARTGVQWINAMKKKGFKIKI